jgi:hypothetical protein
MLATFLVVVCVGIHYEALRLTSMALPYLRIPLRLRIVVVVFACLAAHTLEVWFYATAYWLIVGIAGLGQLRGDFHGEFADYLYFSTVTYTTLGYGDILPLGPVRLIAAIEAMIGIFMIGWSASFTYLSMERLWPLHVRRRVHHSTHRVGSVQRSSAGPERPPPNDPIP